MEGQPSRDKIATAEKCQRLETLAGNCLVVTIWEICQIVLPLVNAIDENEVNRGDSEVNKH